jgi:probable HAF family extracellular repeat protein
MRHSFESAVAVALLLFATADAPAMAQVTFQQFPVREGFINDMSADGSVVVGIWVSSDKPSQAWRWTVAGGVEDLGGDMDVVAISRDGKTIVGRAADAQGIKSAAIWQGGKNWRTLGGVPGSVPDGRSVVSSASGVSADGSVIVGTAQLPNSAFHAFRWNATTGMVDLGTLQGNSSYARSISADGKTIVGYDQVARNGFSPVPDGRGGAIFWNGLERLLHAFGWAGEARFTNDVGSIIVGEYHPVGGGTLPNGQTRPYVGTYLYTAWDGRFQDLGAVWYENLSEDFAIREYTSSPWGVSDNGQVVVGTTGFSNLFACFWTPATGMVLVSRYLTDNGVTAHLGWELTAAGYVSPDGKRIAGTGINADGVGYSWIVTLL